MRYFYLFLALIWTSSLHAQSVLFSENMDTAVLSSLPIGWTATQWKIGDSNSSSGSGQQNIVHTGKNTDRLCTPVLDTRQATLSTLTYLARRTSSYAQLHLVVRASTDGGSTFPYVIAPAGSALPAATSSWRALSFTLPSALSGIPTLQICFDAYGGTSSGSKIQLDDVEILGNGSLNIPAVAFLPTALDMGFVEVEDTRSKALVLRNQTNQTLSLSTSSPPSPWSLDATTATLNPGGTATWNVTLAPTTTATFTASLAITDGSQTWNVALSGTSALPDNYIGFSNASTSGVEKTQVSIPVDLHLGAAPNGLQGLSLVLHTPASGIQQLTILPGSSINNANWNFTTQQSGTEIRILLVGNGTHTLAEGTHTGLFFLSVTPSATSQAVDLSFSLDEITATAGTSQSSALSLSAYKRVHILSIRPKKAFFQLSTAQLQAGTASVGTSTTATFEVSNPNGERTLHISAIASSHPSFTISPATVSIDPNASASFTVTFAPDLLHFGQIQTTLSFTHDGEVVNNQQTLTVEAIGTGGMGDPTDDGRIDVADFTRGVDIFLGRSSPSAQEQLVLDLAPFPGGNGIMDLEDLTVLIRAIATQVWPDGSSLPKPPPANSETSGKLLASGLELELVPEGSSTALHLAAHEPYAAIQLRLRVADSLYRTPEHGYPSGAQVQQGFYPERKEFTLVLYRLDGELFEPVSFSLGLIEQMSPRSLEVVEFVAVGEGSRYLPTQVIRPSATASEDALPGELAFHAPYPQPFSPSRHGTLILEGTLPRVTTITVQVYDLLGRKVMEWPAEEYPRGTFRIQWKGINSTGDALPSGLYFARIVTAHTQQVFTIILSR